MVDKTTKEDLTKLLKKDSKRNLIIGMTKKEVAESDEIDDDWETMYYHSATYNGNIIPLITPHNFNNTDISSDFQQFRVHNNEDLLLFNKIKIVRLVERIHRLDQPMLWSWVYSLLKYEGELEIETTDFEYIVKTYMARRHLNWWWRIASFLYRRKHPKPAPLFPPGDLSLLVDQTPENLSKWATYKINSGGGWNEEEGVFDHNNGVVDRLILKSELEQAGFRCKVSRVSHGTLKAYAYKPKQKGKDYY